MTQQGLGGEDDLNFTSATRKEMIREELYQGLAELAANLQGESAIMGGKGQATADLAAEGMEVVCWSREVDYLPVAVLNLHPSMLGHLRDDR